MQRYGKLDRHSRDKSGQKIKAQLALATDSQWKEIIKMPGYEYCRNALRIEPPSHLLDRYGWRSHREVDSSSEEESDEEESDGDDD